MTDTLLPELPAGAFAKQDGGDDLAFYAPPRLVTHIDAGAIRALTACYATVIPDKARVLDLMSSWISHLPTDRAYAEVIGHGMNGEELAANPQLDRWFVQDLNRDATLPLADATLDAALCCVGVQYLQQPVEVFAAVRRVLVPGAPFVVSFPTAAFRPRQSPSGDRWIRPAMPRWYAFIWNAPVSTLSTWWCLPMDRPAIPWSR